MRLFKIIACLFIVLMTHQSMAQGEKYKAAFLYQFGRILEWPSKSGDFVIAVYGNSSVKPVLEAIAKSKTIGSSKIVVREVSSTTGVADANIVFVASDRQGDLSKISQSIKGKEMLLVFDGKPVDGAGIGFVEVSGKTLFQINKSNVISGGLKSVLSLERLANKVYD